MNKENFQKLINVMERVKARDDSFNVRLWQDSPGEAITTEEELHFCGYEACVGGWLAVSPEWQEAGGTVYKNSGAPKMPGYYSPSDSLAHWLDISQVLAQAILAITDDLYKTYDPDINLVIEKLKDEYEKLKDADRSTQTS